MIGLRAWKGLIPKRYRFAVGGAKPSQPIQTLVFRCAWHEPHVPGTPIDPNVTHGICPACAALFDLHEPKGTA